MKNGVVEKTDPQIQEYLRVILKTPRIGMVDTYETVSLVSYNLLIKRYSKKIDNDAENIK